MAEVPESMHDKGNNELGRIEGPLKLSKIIMETSTESPDPGKANVVKTKTYTRYILDAFQIFCIKRRNDYMKEHPELKNSEVTSILAGLWRNMSDKEKESYTSIARNLQNNKCKVERKIRKVKTKTQQPKNDTSQSNTEITEPDPDLEASASQISLPPPKIYIVSRTGVGEEISEVSYNLLRMQDD